MAKTEGATNMTVKIIPNDKGNALNQYGAWRRQQRAAMLDLGDGFRWMMIVNAALTAAATVLLMVIQTFEVTDQQQSTVSSGRQAKPANLAGVESLA